MQIMFLFLENLQKLSTTKENLLSEGDAKFKDERENI